VAWAKKIIQLSVCPINGMLVTITHNVFGLGEGGLVGCSILAECFCPLLPNPCYKLGGYSAENLIRNDKQKI